MEYAALLAVAIIANNNYELVTRKAKGKSPLEVSSIAKPPPLKRGKIPRPILTGQQYKTPLFPSSQGR